MNKFLFPMAVLLVGILSGPSSVGAVPDPVLVGAGDIAGGGSGDTATANVLADASKIPTDATVFTAGDNAYPDGESGEFNSYYAPSWGTFKTSNDSAYCSQFGLSTPCPRTRPAIGNHDAHNNEAGCPTNCVWPTADQPRGAPGYFGYFGDVASGAISSTSTGQSPGCTINCLGWYSYNLGAWHIVVLNSECDLSDYDYTNCDKAAQRQWLLQDLANSTAKCTVAYWHRPVVTMGGVHGDDEGNLSDPGGNNVWQILYDYGVDLVVNGHEHNYQRYAPLNRNADGVNNSTGMREIVIGTGGRSIETRNAQIAQSLVDAGKLQAWMDDLATYPSGTTPNAFGVLKLSLHSTSFDWEFLPEAGKTYTDSGSQTCHNAPPAPTKLTPVDDSYVQQNLPTSNFGQASSLKVDFEVSGANSAAESYLKFDLTLYSGRTVQSAKLRMYVTNQSSGTENIKTVANDTWTENTVTWNNKPPKGSTIGTFVPSMANQYVEADITSQVTSELGQLMSIAIDTSSADGYDFNSAESATNRVELAILFANDNDGDGVADGTDNCANWPNASQNLPSWTVPGGDPDCDGFATAVEDSAGTVASAHCGSDAWPADINNDGLVDVIGDISTVANFFGQSVPPAPARYDIAPTPPDGHIDVIGDIVKMANLFASSCGGAGGAGGPSGPQSGGSSAKISLDMVTTGNTYTDATNTMTVGTINNCLTSVPGNNGAHNHTVHLAVQEIQDLVGWQARLNYDGGKMRPLTVNFSPFTDSNLGQNVSFLNLPLDASTAVHRGITSATSIPAPAVGPQTALIGATYLGGQNSAVSPDTPPKAPPDDTSYSAPSGGVLAAINIRVEAGQAGQALSVDLDDGSPNAPGSGVVVFTDTGTVTIDLAESALGDGTHREGSAC